jgi:hypothetical protein
VLVEDERDTAALAEAAIGEVDSVTIFLAFATASSTIL